jgi:hypothetical protein
MVFGAHGSYSAATILQIKELEHRKPMLRLAPSVIIWRISEEAEP